MSNELAHTDPEVYRAICGELERQQYSLELIASENFASRAVLEAQGSVMTNKYAEGYPHKRYYGGCQYMDAVEELARERLKRLFNAEHANVQPHSGTQANMAVYLAVLKPGDILMGMALAHGGHLSHGHTVNFSGKLFKAVFYGVNRETELIDYDEMLKIALEHKPKLIVAGASAYPREIDFKKIRDVCDAVGAYFLADIAHIAGLIVAGLHQSPAPYADFITTTTHKTLRGPRGGAILCKKPYADIIDKTVFPGIQGGPLMHAIAAKAVAFQEALTAEFKAYQKSIVRNAKALANALQEQGFRLVSGGTDNHLILVDLTSKNITGADAERHLEEAAIYVNKNAIPFDPRKPAIASGIRLGTPAVTTRGMGEAQMREIAQMISSVLESINSKHESTVKQQVRRRVRELCEQFPLYQEVPTATL